MGAVPVGIALVVAALSYRMADMVLMWVAIVVAAGALWSYGIMHNFAFEATRRNSTHRGFGDFTDAELDAVPAWISAINFVFAVVSVIILAIAAIRSL